MQSCRRGCAEGTMTCTDGFWTDCQTEPRSRSCDNSCGTGIQRCIDETWGPCQVDPVEESCENVCGTGSRTCVDDSWSDCMVADVTESCSFGCGEGTRSCRENQWTLCDAPRPDKTVIDVTIRDFSSTHPDMERSDGGGLELGLVESSLGPDQKPVYARGPSGSKTTSGPDAFYQWYHDSPVSEPIVKEIPLTRQPGSDEFYQYVNRAFFPIDGELLGNEGRPHNYHFTLEAHEKFVYERQQKFSFEGDDDMWVFINGKLVIDLGGTHQTLGGGISLDQKAEELGLLEGKEYSLDIFFAERHTFESNFIIRTSIAGLGTCR